MRYQVLGPLEVSADDRPLSVTAPKHRALVATLLVHANAAVSPRRLIEYIWGDTPPGSGAQLVKVYVSQVRKLLTLPPAHLHSVIATKAPGYMLRVAPGEFDVHVFENLVSEAASALAGGRPEPGFLKASQALALWKGEPFADIPSALLLEQEVPRLKERKMEATELQVDASLQLGRHREILATLEQLVAAHPLRERFTAQLMLALSRSGRRAEALLAYRKLHDQLVQELGLRPDVELQQLQRAILNDDATAKWHSVLPSTQTSAPSTSFGPFQLPPDVADFSGRQLERQQLQDSLRAATDPTIPSSTTTSTIVAITGKAGVGKTALAVHVAHQTAKRFPDGSLYIDLQGQDGAALPPEYVLAEFLRALGVEGTMLPESLEERVRLYRTRMAGRKVLLLLDNAAGEVQVRPLLPAGGGCAALLTSRHPLTGLEAVQRLDLEVFDPEQAMRLLVGIVGQERINTELEAAEMVCRHCGFLPLAVRIAGARLATKPHWSLNDYARRLGDERRALDELVAGDLAVRTSFMSSYQELEDPTRAAFKLLGLVQASDFAAWVLVPLLDLDVDDPGAHAVAEDALERLVDTRLLETSVRDAAGQLRYRFHDLLRVFARDRLRQEDSQAEQLAATERLLQFMSVLAGRSDALLNPAGRTWPGHKTRRSFALALPALESDAARWLEAERTVLVRAVDQAHTVALHEVTWDIAASLVTFLDRGGYGDDHQAINAHALAATRAAGDRMQEARVLLSLGDLNLHDRHTHEAHEHLRSALEIFRNLENAAGVAVALTSWGETLLDLAEYSSAEGALREAHDLFRELGDPHGQAIARYWLGGRHAMMGQYDQALEQFERSHAAFVQLGDQSWVAQSLLYLAIAKRHKGLFTESVAQLERCLTIFETLGERRSLAETRHTLGIVLQESGRFEEALFHTGSALALAKEQGDRFREGSSLYVLGLIHFDQGDHATAESFYSNALQVLHGMPLGEAATRLALGRLARVQGRFDTARAYFADARPVLRDLTYKRGTALLLHELGLLEQQTGSLAEAVQLQSEALAIFRALGHSAGERQVLDALESLSG